MIETMLFTHSILVKVFLAFLVGGIFIPMMTSKNPQGLKKASLFYTFIFQAIATMIAFAGLILMMVGHYPLSIGVMVMIAVWGLMMYIEIRKYKLIKIANLENPTTYTLIKGAFIKISVVQILLVAGMVVLMVLKAKGALSI